MRLPYDLDLALVVTCTLALLGWVAAWLVPLGLRALARAIPRARDTRRRSLPFGHYSQ